ncbi:hypothetical protein E8E95_04560 [Pseudomonas sp. BN414]|uniref:hypothetical protein n=1 Tax=Pseudomonas sp. BN414 TaxID=2567888 RepID=UPI0024563FB7|nr:hypothetical protein [Pseudomonas sp. BN414]MDH4565942.1 hypothetical protein [Pseudomonas sp. BN414]
MRNAIGGAVLLALVGCATSPISAEQADQVPSDRLYSYQTSSDGPARLVVTRDTGFTGSACNTRVLIDGRLAALIGPGETAAFYVPAGGFILAAEGNAACYTGLKEREVVIESGKTKRYRISIDTSFSMDISPTAM